MADIEALYGSNVCDEKREERCRIQDGSDDIHKWACLQCEKTKHHEIHPYTYYLLRLHKLIKAGFPFSKNDLSLKIWEDIALINKIIELKMRIF